MTRKYDLRSYAYGVVSATFLVFIIASVYNKRQRRIAAYQKFVDNEINQETTPSNKSYTRFDPSVFEFLKEMGITKILEMCAGTGENAQQLRNAGFEVSAYDLRTIPDKGVFYGVVGTVENGYPDHLLYLGSAIDSEKSVSNYTGKYVLIGGWGENCFGKELDVVWNMDKPEEVEIVNMALSGSQGDKRAIKLDCRPGYKWMVDRGFRLTKVWFITSDNLSRWNEKVYVQQLWSRDMCL